MIFSFIKPNGEFNSLLKTISDKASVNSASTFRILFFLGEDISLEISHVMIRSYTYALKFTLLKKREMVIQVFDGQNLFGYLDQLDLVESFCDEVLKWILE